MAVVIHGSFDEGPITLALPDYFTGAIGDETDPIFTAWDKSTGIAIGASQVTDFDTEVSNNVAVAANTIKNTYPAADAAKLAAISGTNTGDDTGHDSLVPYSGATGNVDLGSNDLTVNMVTLGGTSTNPTDAATKSYVDSVITTGITWQTAVLDIVTNAASLPGAPTLYDRYITIDDNHIREWGGASWSDTTPSTGWTLYVSENSIAPTNDIGIHTYNGSSWIYIGSSINHNDTSNIQGGAPGDYYHLSAATNVAVGHATNTTADAVPTSLTLSDQGITTGNDGTQSAYVVLTWDAISTSKFDHYHVQYKKSSFTYYQSTEARTNTITIEGLTPNTSYDFRVASVNKYGVTSSYCAALVVTTDSDTAAPANVTIGSATAGIQYVIVEWTQNSDADLASYNIYRHTADVSGSASLIGNCRTDYFVDGGLTGGTTYYYWVKAVDTSGNVSANFSSSVNAIPRNVGTTDVEVIAANKILINGAVYLSNWRHSSDITKIDGGNIYTSSITTTQLNFTPLTSSSGTSDIIATINATAELLSISGNLIEINGSTTFTPIAGDGGSTFSIYPDANTALKITDDVANTIFDIQIGGTNVGDVTIGDYAGGQGIFYDKSEGLTTFKGGIYADTGTISGLLNIGLDTEDYGGVDMSISMQGGQIWENSYNGDGSSLVFNYKGHLGTSDHYRNTYFGNGKGTLLMGILGKGPVLNNEIRTYCPLIMDGSTTYFIPPTLTTSQRTALTPTDGMLIYNTTTHRWNGYSNGNWYYFSAVVGA